MGEQKVAIAPAVLGGIELGAWAWGALGFGAGLVIGTAGVQHLNEQAGKEPQSVGDGEVKNADKEKKQKDVETDPRRRFNQGERERAQDRSKDANGNPTCEYCGVKTTNEPGKPNSAQTDHKHAHSRGGRTDDSNAANSCRTCNSSKGAKELGLEWIPPRNR